MAIPSSIFNGFDSGSAGDRRLTGVPASFFTQLLPQITNINELKVLLHVIYLAGQKRGDPKWVGYWELERSPELVNSLRRPGDPRPPQEHLREGLELAVTRGALIRLVASPAPREFEVSDELEPVAELTSVTWFLLNTPSNRDFVASLENGKVALENTCLVQGLDPWDWGAAEQNGFSGDKNGARRAIERWKELRLNSGRADIYTLYEQNISVLTPLMSERLREAEKLYPPEWIEEAFKQAVTYNRRSWAYISRILENWAAEGRSDYGEGQQPSRGTPVRDSLGRGGTGRENLAGTGKGTPGAQPETAGADLGAERPASPDRAGRPGTRNAPGPAAGPIDFAKYTTGKYAYLTASRQRNEPGGKGDRE